MPTSPRNSERALVIAFLAVLAAVPLTQTCFELARHERVQFTDLFRYRPTAKNLRQFEHTLGEKSWFQQKLRPEVRRLFFAALRDPGAKAVLGRQRWLFYRPDLRYLVEPDHLDGEAADSKWVEPSARRTQRENVTRAIVQFRDQLRERGIVLVVMPVPGKPGVYPDQVTRRAIGRQSQFHSPTLQLLEALRHEGVATVDLFAAFAAARSGAGSATTNEPLYLAHDTHWTPRGAQLAAQMVSIRLREMGIAPVASKEFHAQSVAVGRRGDILEMMQIPRLQEAFPPQQVVCEQVLDPALGPLVPSASDRPGAYRYPGQKASVLVLGDSFCRIYQYAEPQSLGEMPAGVAGARRDESGSRRLLPGSAGFISHLALALRSPVDAIVSDGGASTDVRRKLGTNPGILEGKKVVVWEFVERDIALGRQGWEAVPLPARLD
jgi:hypothetical protein